MTIYAVEHDQQLSYLVPVLKAIKRYPGSTMANISLYTYLRGNWRAGDKRRFVSTCVQELDRAGLLSKTWDDYGDTHYTLA